MTRLHRLAVATATVCVLFGLQLPHLFAQAQNDAADARRLIDILRIRAGATVADVGAGSGLLTIPVARAVGASGRVYATDINPERLKELSQLSSTDANVIVIEGDSAQTNLPAECCDAIFMRHVYHHVGDQPP